MTKRIFRSFFIVTLIVLAASFLLTASVLYGYFKDQYEAQLMEEAYYITRGLEAEGEAYFSELSDSSDRARITWVAPDGTVLFDSAFDPAILGNHLDREEIAEAIEQGEGSATRYSDTLTRETVNCALRLSDGSVLRVSDTHDSLFSLIFTLLQPLLLIVAVILPVSILLSYGLSRKITEPLNHLDLTHPENMTTYDELSPLLERLARQNQQIREQMEQLRRRQEEFTAITENMSEGLLVVDSKTELLSYNSSALHLLDAAPSESGMSALALNRSAGFRRAIDEALAGHHCEEQMKYEDRIYQIIANPVYEKSEAVGAVLLILDITEREEREKLRREFTANVSHELKTPLTSISGFAEMIQMGIAKPQDIGHFAGKIHSEAQRLLGLIDDIMKLSQLDEASLPEPREPIELSSIARTVVDRLTPNAQHRGVTVQSDLVPTKVNGNARILDEMIYNLVENAIKYNKENGNVYLSLQKEGAKVRFTVRDTGIGIPDSDRQRVFERFYRVDKSHSKEIGGTGLGLSIVKHGAAFHGATITLDSTLGQGTVVSLLFPAAEE